MIEELESAARRYQTTPMSDHAYIAACSPDRVLRLLEVVKQAKAVAFSNGFDAALPEKKAALRAALAGLEEGQ